MKTFLKIFLGAIIVAFIVIALNWKITEQRAQLAFKGAVNRQADWLAREEEKANKANYETNRMMSVGAGNLVKPLNEGSGSDESDNKAILVVTGTYNISEGNFFGSTSQDYFHDLMDCTEKGDKKAFTRLLNEGIKTGECIYFKPGEQVTLDGTANGQTEIRVSRFGDSKSYWTIAEAIK